MTRQRRNPRAFTLIEIIIALAMVAIIAASLASTLWTSYRAVREAEANLPPVDQACGALAFIADDLSNALQQAPASAAR